MNISENYNFAENELKYSDLFMLRLIFLHWAISTFITSIAFDTYTIGFVIGGLIALGSYLAYKLYQGTQYYRVVIAIALLSFSALFIQQYYGRIEFHFHIFIALAFLTIYRDRLPLAVASIFIIIHHLIFNYLQQFNISIFDMQIVVFNYGCGFDIVILHAVFVLAEWFVIDKNITRKILNYNIIIESKNELLNKHEELDKEKDKYQKLMSLSTDGIFIMNTSGKLLECSDMAAKMLGYTKEEMLELSVYDWDVSFTKEEALLHTKNTPIEPFPFETIHKRKDGTTYDADIIVVKININNEEIIYASVRDISKKKEDDKLIREQKEEFETIFNHSKDGLAILDLESNFLNFNDTYLEMSDFTREELLTKSCIELTDERDKEKSIKVMKEVVRKEYIQNFEKACILKDDKRIIVNMSLSLMPDKKRVLISVKDTTVIKLIEEQSKLASMGEMIGNIAHQWRQPLSVISTGATGMKIQKEYGVLTDEIFVKTCNDINTNAQYLSKTIDDFKNFIKGDRKKEKFNLNEEVNIFLSLVDGTIKSSNINLLLDIKENIIIDGYPNELVQCFINIFNNARDAFNEKNGFILISALEENDTVIIKIKDNAGGIPNDVLPKIFEPYFTTKHKSQGTGLGLHMTYSLIVDGMKGTISVKNINYEYKNNQYIGAEFTIVLPIN